MFKQSVFIIGIGLLGGFAHAGGGLKYSATYADGTIERVVELRELDAAKVGAIASYSRTDGSSSFVEYAVQCAPLSFAYLGIVEYDTPVTPNLLSVRTASDRLLGNTVRPVQMISLDEGTTETSVRALARAVCS